jgi:sigma-E factor negative regulatory protein RseA
MSSTEPKLQNQAAEQVCAALDGDACALDAVARAWSSDAAVRANWHAYQVIGDALRSADCTGSPERDAALLARVRQRLAAEPVVLAPAAMAPVRPGRRWMPAAVAASVVLAVGWLVLQPGVRVAPAGAEVSAAPAVVVPVAATAPAASLAPASPAVMIRSVELDRYLAAHQQFANTSAVPAPGVVMRSVSISTSPSR